MPYDLSKKACDLFPELSRTIIVENEKKNRPRNLAGCGFSHAFSAMPPKKKQLTDKEGKGTTQQNIFAGGKGGGSSAGSEGVSRFPKLDNPHDAENCRITISSSFWEGYSEDEANNDEAVMKLCIVCIVCV